MVSLSDRLKALGVKVGAQGLPKPASRNPHQIDKLLAGEEILTPFGNIYCVRTHYQDSERYGEIPLRMVATPDLISAWAREPRLNQYPPEDYIFLDTETTGLGMGAGIFPFLVGVGRFVGDVFQVWQFFMRHPGEEYALLYALTEFVSAHKVMVTFNGRAFDGPLLNNRFILNALPSPFVDSCHIDLLHLARRLWRERMPSRTLLNLEAQILGAERTQEDIPGWVIPQLYKDYLHTGDARLIKNVFYHNEKDVLAMVGLLNHVDVLLVQPLKHSETPVLDLIGIGCLHESQRNFREAADIFLYALKAELPDEIYWSTHRRLAGILRHLDEWKSVVDLWKEAAQAGQIYANIELAKYYEHREKDLENALVWSKAGLERLNGPVDRLEWEPDLLHRIQRIERKLNNKHIGEDGSASRLKSR